MRTSADLERLSLADLMTLTRRSHRTIKKRLRGVPYDVDGRRHLYDARTALEAVMAPDLATLRPPNSRPVGERVTAETVVSMLELDIPGKKDPGEALVVVGWKEIEYAFDLAEGDLELLIRHGLPWIAAGPLTQPEKWRFSLPHVMRWMPLLALRLEDVAALGPKEDVAAGLRRARRWASSKNLA